MFITVNRINIHPALASWHVPTCGHVETPPHFRPTFGHPAPANRPPPLTRLLCAMRTASSLKTPCSNELPDFLRHAVTNRMTATSSSTMAVATTTSTPTICCSGSWWSMGFGEMTAARNWRTNLQREINYDWSSSRYVLICGISIEYLYYVDYSKPDSVITLCFLF